MLLAGHPSAPFYEKDFAALIAVAGRNGKWEDAVALLRVMSEHVYPTSSAYLAAMWACARAAQWRAACELLKEMTEHGLLVPAAFTAATSACRAAGQWEAAKSLVVRARETGVKCDRFVYMHAIDACEAAGQREEAMQLYDMALKDGAISHWIEDEPFTVDLHGLSQETAACAVRHVLRHEVGNFMSGDLKIVTGSGRHSPENTPMLLPRVERLLEDEFGLQYEFEWQQRCCTVSRECTLHVNAGCIVVQMQDLFRYLTKTRAFETYVIEVPDVEDS